MAGLALAALVAPTRGSTRAEVATATGLALLSASLAGAGGVAQLVRWRMSRSTLVWWSGLGLLLVSAVVAMRWGLPLSMRDVDAATSPAGDALTVALLVVAAVGAAVTSVVAARQRRRVCARTSALLAVALVATAVVRWAAAPEHPDGDVWSMAVLSVGAGTAAHAALRALNRALLGRADELDGLRRLAEASENRARSLRIAVEDRAHEVHNALWSIDAAVSALRRDRAELPEEIRERLADAVTMELDRLRALVQTTTRMVAVTDFNVAEAVDPVVVAARARGLLIESRIPVWLRARGDPPWTAEIIDNLLRNAERHAGGRDLLVEADGRDGRVWIAVADRGPGVPPADRERVFERGVAGSGDGHGHPDRRGHGLGLHISRRLARSQGGDLSVGARPGGGAIFLLELEGSTAPPGSAPVAPVVRPSPREWPVRV